PPLRPIRPASYTALKLFLSLSVSRSREVGLARFFLRHLGLEAHMTDLQQDIQSQLSELDPEIDLLAVEQPGGEMLRLFIDHPDGVDLALCERVTHHLNHLRADYALEVSSPGDKYRRKRASSTASETKESSQ